MVSEVKKKKKFLLFFFFFLFDCSSTLQNTIWSFDVRLIGREQLILLVFLSRCHTVRNIANPHLLLSVFLCLVCLHPYDFFLWVPLTVKFSRSTGKLKKESKSRLRRGGYSLNLKNAQVSNLKTFKTICATQGIGTIDHTNLRLNPYLSKLVNRLPDWCTSQNDN